MHSFRNKHTYLILHYDVQFVSFFLSFRKYKGEGVKKQFFGLSTLTFHNYTGPRAARMLSLSFECLVEGPTAVCLVKSLATARPVDSNEIENTLNGVFAG